MKKGILLVGISYLSSPMAAEPPKNDTAEPYQGEDMVITAPVQQSLFPTTTQATPSYSTTAEEIETRVNATTVEDTLRYAPGVLIRKRFIGDPNGNLGIRTSNSFQTTHTSVYADGMPLHNPLRTSFNGAPRWSMVAPSEVESVEVLYGPFSAQYGGASFGGVVNLNTRMPEQFEAHMDAMGIFQDMHRGGRNELLSGYKTNISAGNRFDKFSIFGSYNRFENEGQPQSPRTNRVSRGANGIAAAGGLFENQPTGAPGIWYGDDGVAQQATDLFKLKMGYDFTDDLKGLFTIAYEQRFGETDDPLSLLKDASGNTLWGGGTASGASSNATYNQSGQVFSVPGSAFSVGESERNTLNYGLNLKGKISEDWSIDTTASYYDAFKDRSVSSNLNPNHPLNQNKGQVSDVDAWWAAYDLKLATDNFLDRDDLSFMAGYQFNHAHLNLDVFDSNNYLLQSKDSHLSDSGGETQTNSAFTQLEWRFLPDWSIMAGARFDHWQSINGHVRDFSKNNIQNYADRDASRVSPKASLEYSPDAWTFRYSFSKAYRFPIAEELFASVSRLNNQSISAPDLGPENGYFHNFMTQYDIPRGYIRANFFYDQINNEIASTLQNFGSDSVTTFLPIEQTEAIGVDLTFLQNEIFDLPLDLMLNGTYIDKQITKNSRNTDLVGSQWDRLPKLQANASLTYHIMPAWDSSVSVRYRSDSFQRLDNTDTEANVFGGTDESTFVDLRTNYRLNLHPKLKSTLSAGIDNLFDVNAYENHPYPQRTFFVKAALDY
jgi:iron complex outermembrane receptor protein